MKKDYYAILNITLTKDQKVIKSAYRQMALKYHPDHNPDNKKALEKFNEAREAFEVLSDPKLKSQYDSNYAPQAPKSYTPPPKKTQGPHRAIKKNLRYNLYITLEDVNKGCSRGIRYIRKNNGESETVQLKVSVPRGAFHQQRLKLVGYGDIGKSSSGDLVVILHLQNHPIFIQEGLNLRANVPVSYADVLLGNKVKVPTLSGTRDVQLKACNFDHLDFHLQGMGLPDSKQKYKGDLTVHCFVSHPEALTSQEKVNLQRWGKSWPQTEMMRQYQTYLKERTRS